MSVGTAFHPRTADLNVKQQWREWSGYLAASAYADHHQIEYNALRESAGLIDVSPLFKYRIAGPGAEALVDRLITRDAKKLTPGRVYYSPWCDEAGRVIDDGTIHRLDDGSFRWTAADPQYRWLQMNAGGLDVEVEDVSADWAAIALQGPRSRDVLEAATGESFADLRYFRRPSLQFPPPLVLEPAFLHFLRPPLRSSPLVLLPAFLHCLLPEQPSFLCF